MVDCIPLTWAGSVVLHALIHGTSLQIELLPFTRMQRYVLLSQRRYAKTFISIDLASAPRTAKQNTICNFGYGVPKVHDLRHHPGCTNCVICNMSASLLNPPKTFWSIGVLQADHGLIPMLHCYYSCYTANGRPHFCRTALDSYLCKIRFSNDLDPGLPRASYPLNSSLLPLLIQLPGLASSPSQYYSRHMSYPPIALMLLEGRASRSEIGKTQRHSNFQGTWV